MKCNWTHPWSAYEPQTQIGVFAHEPSLEVIIPTLLYVYMCVYTIDASISAIAKLDEEAETLSLELDRLRRREQELKEKCNETVSHLESLKIKLAQEKHLEADFLKEREKGMYYPYYILRDN